METTVRDKRKSVSGRRGRQGVI